MGINITQNITIALTKGMNLLRDDHTYGDYFTIDVNNEMRNNTLMIEQNITLLL